MSQSGQQHPKADTGGQRPADDKKPDSRAAESKGSVKDTVDAGGKSHVGSAKDAKK